MNSKKTRVWLSYDLGVSGDYPALYSWLDDQDAVECGNSVASFYINVPEEKEPHDYLKEVLTGKVNLKPSNRLYCVCRKIDGTYLGRFIYGGRKSNPWTGYGSEKQSEGGEE